MRSLTARGLLPDFAHALAVAGVGEVDVAAAAQVAGLIWSKGVQVDAREVGHRGKVAVGVVGVGGGAAWDGVGG
jgi:hypothetical protein